MFDPERDDVQPVSRYYHRLVVLVAVGAVSIMAAWPSITVFRSASDPDQKCIAAHELIGPRHPACTSEAGHRLALTALALTAVLIVALVAAYRFDRERRRSQERPASKRVFS